MDLVLFRHAGQPGQLFRVPECVYDAIYDKGYAAGKEEGELAARKDIAAARLELAALRLDRLRGGGSTPPPSAAAVVT